MDQYLLRDQLTKLHEELGNVSRVDARSNQLLAEIRADIERLLNQSPVASAVAPATHSTAAAVHSTASAKPTASAVPPAVAALPGSTLPDRLERMAIQFEVDHPTLSASSRRLVDLLGKAGL